MSGSYCPLLSACVGFVGVVLSALERLYELADDHHRGVADVVVDVAEAELDGLARALGQHVEADAGAFKGRAEELEVVVRERRAEEHAALRLGDVRAGDFHMRRVADGLGVVFAHFYRGEQRADAYLDRAVVFAFVDFYQCVELSGARQRQNVGRLLRAYRVEAAAE